MSHGGDRYGNSVQMDFSVNTNPLGMPESVLQAAMRGVAHSTQYPDVRNSRLRTLFSERWEVPEESLFFGNGAAELLKRAPEFDYIIAPEAKAIPLAYEMARQSGKPYLLARKKAKAYMSGVFSVTVQSITTAGEQTLIIDAADADAMKGKRILLLDDVISTGESLKAVEKLVRQAGGEIVGKMAILAEGAAQDRPDILYLEKLPLFNPDGSIKE